MVHRRRAGRAAFAAGAALLAGVAMVPVAYRMSARERAGIEGQVQRVLAAPFESFVSQAPVRPGHRVARGDLLARLDDHDLLVEHVRQSSEQAQ